MTHCRSQTTTTSRKTSAEAIVVAVLTGTLFGLLIFSTAFAAEEPVKDTVSVEKLIDFPKPLPRHVTAFSNTNQLFVYHLFQNPNLVYHWSIGEKKVLKTYDIGEGYICDGIKISSDGRFTLIACHSNKDFTTKVLLIDNERKTLVRSIPFPGDVSVVSAMQFSTNGESFSVTISFQKTTCYDTTGTKISDFDVPRSLTHTNQGVSVVPNTNQRVWVVPNSKMTPMSEWGVYCRDNTGREHRLFDQGHTSNLVVTTDNRYVAFGSNGELLIWRLSDGQQIFRKRLAKQSGFVLYDATDNLILWADVDGSELLGIRVRIQMP
jgi:hypothetical protein